MRTLDDFLICSGEWQGTNRVQLGNSEPVHESSSRVVVTPIVRQKLIRVDQTWCWMDQRQIGAMLIGYDRASDTVSLHWVDTFHTSKEVMSCTGSFDPLGKLIVHGSYASPPGPDWGWRIEISWIDGSELRIDMFNIDPSGKEDRGVWASFARV
jgi:hypothetical protein